MSLETHRLISTQVPDKVHWFSIVNSLLIVLFLTVMVAMIMVRNLHRDIVRYNRVLSDEEKAEDREECDLGVLRCWGAFHVTRVHLTMP